MAKKAAAASADDQEQMLAPLRQALSGETVRLHGPASTPGIFPAGKGGESLLAKALAQGWIEEDTGQPSVKRGARPPRLGRLTAKGRAYVLSQSSPLRIAEGLKAVLDTQGRLLAEQVEAMAAATTH